MANYPNAGDNFGHVTLCFFVASKIISNQIIESRELKWGIQFYDGLLDTYQLHYLLLWPSLFPIIFFLYMFFLIWMSELAYVYID